MWGVGCIFVEMITGMPTFPGIRDTYDQLDKIFKILGTPTEESWQGVTHLPGYKLHMLGNVARYNSPRIMTNYLNSNVFRLLQTPQARLKLSPAVRYYRG